MSWSSWSTSTSRRVWAANHGRFLDFEEGGRSAVNVHLHDDRLLGLAGHGLLTDSLGFAAPGRFARRGDLAHAMGFMELGRLVERLAGDRLLGFADHGQLAVDLLARIMALFIVDNEQSLLSIQSSDMQSSGPGGRCTSPF